jgi:hypothetical protein
MAGGGDFAGGSAGGNAGGSGGASAGGDAGGAAGGMAGAGGSAGGSAGGTSGGTSQMSPCQRAVVLAPGSNTFVGSTVDAGNAFQFPDVNACQGSNGEAAGDRVFAVPVGTNQRLVATLTNGTDGGDTDWDSTLNLVAGLSNCGAAVGDGGTRLVCAAGVDDPEPQQLIFMNTGSATTAYLIVDGYASGAGPFGLDVSVGAPPSSDRCESPARLVLNAPVTVSLAPLANDYLPSAATANSCRLTEGRDYVATVTVANNQRLTVTSVPGAGVDTTISLLAGGSTCGVSPCLSAGDTFGVGGTDIATYDNRTGAPQSLLVIVDSNSVIGSAASFTLTASTTALFPPLNGGETCAAPTALANGTVTGSLSGFANDFAFPDTNLCLGRQPSGPDSVYSVSVPAGLRLVATLAPTFDAHLNAVLAPASNCGVLQADGGTAGITCVAGSDRFGVANERLVYTNQRTAGAADTVLLIVDSAGPLPTGATYDLTTVVGPVPPNETCATAGAPATAASTFTGDLSQATGDYFWGGNGGCVSLGSIGPDMVYAATVGAGRQVTARVTATSGAWDPAINIVDGTTCARSLQTCLASSNGSTGPNETAVFQNTGSTSRTVFIVVETSSPTPGGFSLALTFAPIQTATYTQAPISAACNDLTSGATDLLSLTTAPTIGDDVTTPLRVLPFPFSFFGSPMTHFSAQSNGMVQFHANAGGIPSSDYNNQSIPSLAVPNGYAAPFWDDLLSTSGSVVRNRVFGTTPNRFSVVEWVNQLGVSTRFQLKFFETSNVIEFHYCDMGTVLTKANSTATVGLESLNGLDGVNTSFNTHGTTWTGTGWRYTP